MLCLFPVSLSFPLYSFLLPIPHLYPVPPFRVSLLSPSFDLPLSASPTPVIIFVMWISVLAFLSLFVFISYPSASQCLYLLYLIFCFVSILRFISLSLSSCFSVCTWCLVFFLFFPYFFVLSVSITVCLSLCQLVYPFFFSLFLLC